MEHFADTYSANVAHTLVDCLVVDNRLVDALMPVAFHDDTLGAQHLVRILVVRTGALWVDSCSVDNLVLRKQIVSCFYVHICFRGELIYLEEGDRIHSDRVVVAVGILDMADLVVDPAEEFAVDLVAVPVLEALEMVAVQRMQMIIRMNFVENNDSIIPVALVVVMSAKPAAVRIASANLVDRLVFLDAVELVVATNQERIQFNSFAQVNNFKSIFVLVAAGSAVAVQVDLVAASFGHQMLAVVAVEPMVVVAGQTKLTSVVLASVVCSQLNAAPSDGIEFALENEAKIRNEQLFHVTLTGNVRS